MSINEERKIILQFLGIEIKKNVSDWSKSNDLSLTEIFNNDNKTHVSIPKGSGHKWYKIKHRDEYYQLYTDFTFEKIKEETIEDIFYKENTFYALESAAFKTNWNWLIPVIKQCYILNNEEDFNAFPDLCEINIETSYTLVVNFIKEYNKNKK